MEEDLMITPLAAEVLAKELGGRTVEGWSLWLRNNRNQSRDTPYRVSFQKISNGAFYARADLDEYIKWEKARQLGSVRVSARAMQALDAYGVGHPDGSATGRKLKVVGMTAQVDEATKLPFVQVILENPLRVYRIPVEQAAALAAEFNALVEVCRRGQQ